MGFFDNVKNSFTETSQDLTKKAKDTTEIFRLNNLNKTKEKEIEKVIYQIGLAFYSNKKDECTAMFPELMAQVETLQKEIAENKETIENIREIHKDDNNNIEIYIGEENKIDNDVTVIKTTYKTENDNGTIAIIGPKRMDYERVVSMLEYIKKNIER